MLKKDYYKKIYEFDKSKNAYIIDISLDSYTDPLNDWDKSPLRKRDIHPELISFLEEASLDIPLKEKLIIRMFLPEDKKNDFRELKLQQAIKNYFMFQMYHLSMIKSEHTKNALYYILLALFFLGISLYLTSIIKLPYLGLAKEGLNIGGWVFLWEAFDYLFFRNGERNKTYREYKRFYNSKLTFVYQDGNV